MPILIDEADNELQTTVRDDVTYYSSKEQDSLLKLLQFSVSSKKDKTYYNIKIGFNRRTNELLISMQHLSSLHLIGPIRVDSTGSEIFSINKIQTPEVACVLLEFIVGFFNKYDLAFRERSQQVISALEGQHPSLKIKPKTIQDKSDHSFEVMNSLRQYIDPDYLFAFMLRYVATHEFSEIIELYSFYHNEDIKQKKIEEPYETALAFPNEVTVDQKNAALKIAGFFRQKKYRQFINGENPDYTINLFHVKRFVNQINNNPTELNTISLENISRRSISAYKNNLIKDDQLKTLLHFVDIKSYCENVNIIEILDNDQLSGNMREFLFGDNGILQASYFADFMKRLDEKQFVAGLLKLPLTERTIFIGKISSLDEDNIFVQFLISQKAIIMHNHEFYFLSSGLENLLYKLLYGKDNYIVDAARLGVFKPNHIVESLLSFQPARLMNTTARGARTVSEAHGFSNLSPIFITAHDSLHRQLLTNVPRCILNANRYYINLLRDVSGHQLSKEIWNYSDFASTFFNQFNITHTPEEINQILNNNPKLATFIFNLLLFSTSEENVNWGLFLIKSKKISIKTNDKDSDLYRSEDFYKGLHVPTLAGWILILDMLANKNKWGEFNICADYLLPNLATLRDFALKYYSRIQHLPFVEQIFTMMLLTKMITLPENDLILILEKINRLHEEGSLTSHLTIKKLDQTYGPELRNTLVLHFQDENINAMSLEGVMERLDQLDPGITFSSTLVKCFLT